MAILKDTQTYYDRVKTTLQAGFVTDEEKELFLNNVIDQISNETLDVCKDFSISLNLEELLQHCSDQHLCVFISCLAKDWSNLVQHKIASHVVQQILIRLPNLLSQNESVIEDLTRQDSEDAEEDDSTSAVSKVTNAFLKLCHFFEHNIKICFENQYCCQVFRTLLEVCGGVEKFHCVERKKMHKKKKGKSKSEVSEVIVEVPLSVRMKLRRILKPVTCMLTNKVYKKFKSITFISRHVNLLIQTAIKIERDIDATMCNKHCRKIAVVLGLNETTPSDTIPPIFENTDQQFLFESIIQGASDELSTDIYNKMFKGRLERFAVHKKACYSLKVMIDNIQQDQFLDLYDEIEMSLEKIFKENPQFNITDMIANGCLKFRCNQARFVKQLLQVLHCGTPEERKLMIAPLIVKWQTYEEFYNIQNEEDASERICIDEVPLDYVSKNGCYLLQKLFKFGSNKIIVDSILNIETEDLCRLATSQLGGFIIQAFCESSNISQKICDTFCDKFTGSFVKIACDRWGSRAIEDMYKCASSKMKSAMAQELSYFLRKLQNDIYGHFVCRKLALYHFLHRHDDWESIQKSESRKRKLFKDIIEDTSMTNSKPVKSENTKTNLDLNSDDESGHKKKKFQEKTKNDKNKQDKKKNKKKKNKK